MKKAIQIYVETLTNGDMADISSFGRDRILEAMKRYAAEAIRESAERAVTKFGKCCDCDCDDDEVPECRSCRFLVDRQSILNLLNELK